MNKHPYRAVLIGLAFVLALVMVYPTAGWMFLSEEERTARLDRWQEEDDAFAAEKPSAFREYMHDIKRWIEFDRDRVINLGLDLQGGIHMVLSFDHTKLSDERLKDYEDNNYEPEDIEKEVQQIVLQQIRRRIHDFEAKEPVIQALGKNQIQVQLPGEKRIERARKLITKTAQLNFHIVVGTDETTQVFSTIKNRFPDQFTPFLKRPVSPGMPFRVAAADSERIRRVVRKVVEAGDVLPEGKRLVFSQTPKAFEDQHYELYLLDEVPIASGEGLRSASAITDPSNPGYWQILFGFSNTAGADFGKATEKNINRAMAIVLDGVVVSAPVIRDRITTNGQITGSFEGPEAADLAIALNSGSMVVPVREEFTRVVGPSLGKEMVTKGVTSAFVGIAIVGVFMAIYYMAAGAVALFALAFNAVLVIAAMAYFGMTLTLPGIAGLILTVGMAVDANVLIFERIREELRLGHSLLSSVDNGFARATVTILDANVTTLIAAAVLMQFGTGPIEGFAVTLSVGVCSSVFAALVVSRALIDFLLSSKSISDLKMMSIIRPNTKIPFLQSRGMAAIVSVVIIAVGVAMFSYRTVSGEMFGVDFTQGTNIDLTITSDAQITDEAVRQALTDAGFESPIVQMSGDGSGEAANRFIIRVAEVTQIEEALTETAPADAAPDMPGEDAEVAAPVEVAPEEEAGEEVAEDSAETVEEAAPADKGVEDAAEEAGDAADDGTEAPIGASGEIEDPPAALPAAHIKTVAERIEEACAALTSNGSIKNIGVNDEQTVGPAVGHQLRLDAIKALFYALVFIVIYLWVRFEFKFALGALVALVHDVLITVGVISLLGRQITMPVVAALLTIIGYSLNDTIVVFDRVREDVKLQRGKGVKFMDILNIAINSTLSRTLLTSITTLFVVGVLFIFGGDAINDFSLALILGVLVGTYSSIFIACPVVYFIESRFGQGYQGPDSNRGGNGGKRTKNGKNAGGKSKAAKAKA